MLLPFNVFLSATEYFSQRFAGSVYQANFQNYFTFLFMGVNLLFLTLAMVRQHLANFSRQVILSSLVNVAIFAALWLSTFFSDALNPTAYFWAAATAISITAISTSYIQNSIFALVSPFPSHHMQGVLSGQGLAGVASALTPLIIALTVPAEVAATTKSIQERARGYFLACFVVCLISLFSFLFLRRTPLYQHYHSDSGSFNKKIEHQDVEKWDISTSSTSSAKAAVTSNGALHLNWQGLRAVLARIPAHAAAVTLCFVVTLGLFPGITGAIGSSDQGGRSRLANPAIFVLVHFVIFNAGDYTGRYLPLLHRWLNLSKSSHVLTLSLVRLAFFPLLMLCNLSSLQALGGDGATFPILIKNDAAYFIILALFALSNGWLGTVCMMSAPKRVKHVRDEALLGMVMSFTMTVGMTLGSFLSFALRGFICQCNPFVN